MISQTFIDNILTVMYLLMWIFTLVTYQFLRKKLDAGSAIMATYVMYAVFSVITLNDDLFNFQYEPLTFFPFLYLYVMLMIALSPTIYLHFIDVNKIKEPNARLIKPFCILFILCALIMLPNIIGNFEDGVMKLFTDTDAGNDAYEEQLENTEDAGSAIENLFAIIFNASYDVAIFFAFYFLMVKKNWYLILGLFFGVAVGVMLPIMKGQRGVVIYSVLTVVVCFMLFKAYLSKKIVHVVRIFGIISAIMVVLPIAAITVSRFGERNAGVTGYINWYVGQGNLYFNNYGLDAGGIRYGDRTMYLVKRIIDSDTPKNFLERRMKYHNLEIDDYYFTTFVGDFCIDFGPILAFIIFVVFNIWVLKNIRANNKEMELHQMLLLYFTMCICMQGGMTLFSYADTSNLKIVVIGVIYIYLRLHEVLLKKFPKTKSIEPSIE